VTAGPLEEAPRGRRSQYRSERRRQIGIEAYLNKKTDRKLTPEGKRKLKHPLAFTPLRGKFRWRKY
jgi:hypothetical protein